jgi:hypothetical protein
MLAKKVKKMLFCNRGGFVGVSDVMSGKVGFLRTLRILGQRTGAEDPATHWAGGQEPWILLPIRLADRSRGSCYPLGWRTGAVDPATQWAGGQEPWILLPNGPVDRCHGSCYPMGQRIGVVDPATQWASGQVPWILLPSGLADR